ncbi:D-beta-hydroxybutyrate dehydrogenase, mitochondrial-like [Acanthaster planci]|uniref:D-beta-hydroxybutyrate dehydrogenase, mitochondrial-like n=1 Tax=Acanthaster planci TaxID=133434 RepID=A0A8B7YEF3_ACAPL|nr:D-beta-hydroxybutyrate dehydrogenase, mitochondrial-like [Acanthaster planci]
MQRIKIGRPQYLLYLLHLHLRKMAAASLRKVAVFALCLGSSLILIVPHLGHELLTKSVGCFLAVGLSYLISSWYTGGKISSVRGKAVLVTGCDTGIGNALARHLDSLGFRVFAGCLFAEDSAALRLTAECSKRLEVVQLDVTSDLQVSRAVSYVRDSLSATGDVLWGVVNNAGMACWGEVDWVSLDRYKRLAEVNVWGMIRVTKAFLPFIRNCGGRVVNISSMLGHFSAPGCSAYCITKYGVQAFTDSLRNEVNKFGVSAVIVEPGNFSGGQSAMFTRENMFKDLDRAWSEAPEEVRGVYGTDYFEAFKNALVNASHYTATTSLSLVTEACASALIDANPHERYFPGNWTSKLTVLIFCFLPASFTDVLFRVYQSLFLVKVKWAKSKNQR